MKVASITLVLGLLTGCAFSNSVNKLGPDTYSVGAIGSPMCGGSACAESAALSEANRFCESQGKEILVTNTSAGVASAMRHGNSTITFRCLAKGDSELARPDYRSAPSVVIEDARR